MDGDLGHLEERCVAFGVEDRDGHCHLWHIPEETGPLWSSMVCGNRSEARAGGRASLWLLVPRNMWHHSLPYPLLIPCSSKAVLITEILGNPQPLERE